MAKRRAGDPAFRDLEYFQWIGRTLATRATMFWLFLVCLWLGWRQRTRLSKLITSFFMEKDTPLNLGVFRIVMFGLLFMYRDQDNLAYYSTLPDELLFPPAGLGPLLAWLPRSPEIAEWSIWLLRIFCVLAMFGVLTRITTIATVLLALYVLGLPQMFGKVNHVHHVIWFTALLAASPCGAALSVDSLVKKLCNRENRLPRKAIAYALPLRFTWILLGLIYFFPGFWKLWTGGVDWILSDHLQNQMYHLWSTHQDRYEIRFLAESKFLTVLGGVGTIAFELSFIFLMFHRSTRALALIGGLLFHNAVGITLRIAFYTLQASYVSLIDWQWLRDRFGESEPYEQRAGQRPPSPLPTVLVGIIILVPTFWFGFKGESDGWPFACYPRFAYPIFEPERSVIEFDTVNQDGIATNNKLEKLRSNFRTARWIGLLRSVLATTDEDLRNKRLATLGTLAQDETEEATTLRFYRATYSTLPQDWENPPLRRDLLAEIRVQPPPLADDGP